MNENTPELITSECSLIILTFLFLVAKRIQLNTCTFSFQARVISVRIDQSVIPVPTIINKQGKGSELVLLIAVNCAEIVTDSCEMDVNFTDNRDSNASIQNLQEKLISQCVQTFKQKYLACYGCKGKCTYHFWPAYGKYISKMKQLS